MTNEELINDLLNNAACSCGGWTCARCKVSLDDVKEVLAASQPGEPLRAHHVRCTNCGMYGFYVRHDESLGGLVLKCVDCGEQKLIEGVAPSGSAGPEPSKSCWMCETEGQPILRNGKWEHHHGNIGVRNCLNPPDPPAESAAGAKGPEHLSICFGKDRPKGTHLHPHGI